MNVLTTVLLLSGAAFLLLASIGVVRLPDLFCRMSAATKAATLGLGCVLAGVALHFQDPFVTTRVVATLAFLLLTSPVAAHVIARAAFRNRIPFWPGTAHVELPAGASQADPAVPPRI